MFGIIFLLQFVAESTDMQNSGARVSKSVGALFIAGIVLKSKTDLVAAHVGL